MSLQDGVKWIHLVAAATWTGGLLTLAALVPAMRRAGADRSILRAVARRFGTSSWIAFAVAVATGIWQVELVGHRYGALALKLALVALAGALALVHQLTARRTSASVRGLIQAAILVVSIGIFGAAVAAFG